ncbi:MAG TPA: FAD/NAD(P)-binding protein [Pseudonocardiaceae bacterium]
MTDQPAVIAIVGGGPRAAGFLERLGANLPDIAPGRRIEVHVIDPYPPGAGRVWRFEQSPLLRMNSMAEDVTMFTDDSVQCEGPIRPGPSLAEWAALERAATPPEQLDPELAELTPTSFATRRVQSRYLAWFFQHTVANLPSTIDVSVHAARVEKITGAPTGRQRVWLADHARPIVADVVVLTLGHLDANPTGESARLLEFATEHGTYYLPPAYSADVDLSAVQPGQTVLVRGLGLAFIDLMALLTEGRGGRYETGPDGELSYVSSGEEPVLYVGSRRGVPYHAKTTYRLAGPRPPLPHFFDAATVDQLIADNESIDYRAKVWPLQAKEIAWAYYHELHNGHPDRVLLSWSDFAARFTELTWDTEDMAALIAESVPDRNDRLDFPSYDRPIDGRTFPDFAALQQHLRDYIRADLTRRSDPGHSADLGAFFALLSIYGQLPRLVASGKLTATSRLRDLEGWWAGFFSYYASGPPGDRLEQLLALSRAGIVRFLGADMWVNTDAKRGVFVAGSTSTAEIVRADALIEARLPKATVRDTAEALLGGLHRGGDVADEVVVHEAAPHSTGLVLVAGAEGRVIDAAGRTHPRRFALGPYTTTRTAAAFARPGTNAPAFRYNDAAARSVLTLLRTDATMTDGDQSRTASRVKCESVL